MPPAREAIRIEFPGRPRGPLRNILLRLAIALGLITFVALLTYVGRDGYADPEDDAISLLDAFYYSTVSITTTGYGDVRPVTDGAHLRGEDEAGPLRALGISGPIVAVIRGEDLMRLDDPRAGTVKARDRVVFVRSNRH